MLCTHENIHSKFYTNAKIDSICCVCNICPTISSLSIILQIVQIIRKCPLFSYFYTIVILQFCILSIFQISRNVRKCHKFTQLYLHIFRNFPVSAISVNLHDCRLQIFQKCPDVPQCALQLQRLPQLGRARPPPHGPLLPTICKSKLRFQSIQTASQYPRR